jgi:hypothetical protein
MAAEILGDSTESRGATPLGLRDRPWHVFSGRLTARLDELAAAEVWSMDAQETAETVVELQRARLGAAQARLLAHADRLDVAGRTCATSTAAWWRGQVPVTPRTARRAVALAEAVDSDRYPATVAALSAGQLQVDQAEAIIEAVDALPDRLFAEERERGARPVRAPQPARPDAPEASRGVREPADPRRHPPRHHLRRDRGAGRRGPAWTSRRARCGGSRALPA